MDWKVGLPVLVGERVSWADNPHSQPKTGIIKWIGNIDEIDSVWSVGLEMDEPLTGGGCDGHWKDRKVFECQPQRGLIVPIQQIQKLPPKSTFQQSSFGSHSSHKLEPSQVDKFTASNLKKNAIKKSEEVDSEGQYSSLKFQLDDWISKNDINQKKRQSGVFKKCDKSILRLKQNHFFRSKIHDEKLSLKGKERKRHSLLETNYKTLSSRKFEDDLQLVRKSLDACSYFTINNFCESPNKPDSIGNMNGYFKEIKEDEVTNDAYRKPITECEKQLGGHLSCDYYDSTSDQSKEKKFFSFLKWFKKNKDSGKSTKNSSVASSPVLERKENSSCESLDTIFSTQTVRSFAYIPPTQYQPSAPSSSLLGLNKDENGTSGEKTHNKEPIYDRKKKRKAPDPPSPCARGLTRENSLPSTLDRKEDPTNSEGTFHRRTVSESFKDKKAGAYCHVQGKKKAPLPPSKGPSLYPNLNDVNPTYQSLHRKKKPAPPPPSSPSNQIKTGKTVRHDGKLNVSNSPESPKYLRHFDENKSTEGENSSIKISSSPLPARPWYKRSHRDSGSHKSSIKRDLLKSFDKKKNKESEDWMSEVGFSRRSLSTTDSIHNKFTIFPKIDEKNKGEKRKSQISILTNISELDKEAAEILRKEQAEEKKMMAENDARFYSPPSNPFEEISGGEKKTKESKSIENDSGVTHEQGKIADAVEPVNESKNHSAEVKSYKFDEKPEMNSGGNKEQNTVRPENKTEANAAANLNYFDVKNKEVRYLNEPWVCGKCTLENPGWRVFCEICSSVKPHFLYNSNINSSNAENSETKSIQESSKSLSGADETLNQETKASPEELRKKRLDFFTPKTVDKQPLEKNKRDEVIKNHPDANKDLENVDGGQGGALSKRDEPEKKFQDPVKRNNKVDTAAQASTSTAEILNDDRKPNAVEKRPTSNNLQVKKDADKVIEAYIITQTTVLEDIIIKKKTDNIQKQENKTPQTPVKAVKNETHTPKDLQQAGSFKVSKKLTPLDLTPTGADLEQDLKDLTKKLTRAEGVADFKADIKTMAPNTAMNTVAVNKLLRKLEAAINNGDQVMAAGLAEELALLKINCSVTRQGATASSGSDNITVDMYVEDKVSHQGPIQVRVSPSMTLLQLKKKVHQELGIPVNVQRWILGKRLATDNNKTLESDGVKNDSCSVFLYLMTPDDKEIEGSEGKLTSNNSLDENTSTDLAPTDLGVEVPRSKDKEDRKTTLQTVANEKTIDLSTNSHKDAVDKSTDESIKLETTNSQDQIDLSHLKKGDDKPEKTPSIFRLLSRDGDTEVDKELKLISANSVKQKVQQLNKTFEENSKKEKFEPNSSGSWKCLTCTYVNSAGRQICFACSSKKTDFKRKAEAPRIPKTAVVSTTGATGTTAMATTSTTKVENTPKSSALNNLNYDELMKLQDADIVPNTEPFYCPICLVDYSPGEGIILKDCLHTFCRLCLINTVQYSEDAEVKCPYLDEKYSCTSVLQQREIKALVPKNIFDQHLAKSVKEAENKIGNAFHCKTPDCKGWCIFEDNVNEFHCPVCNLINCLTCHAIHTGINCKEYQEKMKDASDTDADAKKTRDMLEEMVAKGEAMACPKCQVVLMKKWGCDWLRCSMCKTEICWVTRGFRWGPAGKGDTSAGCKCGINGVKCHPKCNYCH